MTIMTINDASCQITSCEFVVLRMILKYLVFSFSFQVVIHSQREINFISKGQNLLT